MGSLNPASYDELGMNVTIFVAPYILRLIAIFLICISCLFAVRRGLFALQGYALYRAARSGRQLPLAYSRFQFATGRLTLGTPLVTALLFLIKLLALALAISATYGLFQDEMNEGFQPRFRWSPKSFRRMSTLEASALPESGSATGAVRPEVLATLGCVHHSQHAITYPHAAYNSTDGPSSVTCQERGLNSFGWNHSLKVESRDSSYSVFDPLSATVMNATINNATGTRWSSDVVEHQNVLFSVGLSSLPGTGRILIYGNGSRSIAVVILQHQESVNGSSHPSGRAMMSVMALSYIKDFTLSYGNFTDVSLNGTSPLYVSPMNITSAKYNFMRVLQQRMSYEDVQADRRNVPHLIELILRRGVVSVQPTMQLYTKVYGPVLNVPIFSIVLFTILIAMALVLGFMREILGCCLMRQGTILASEMFMNDFNQLSKNMRYEMERLNGDKESGEFTLLGIREDDDGVERVALILPAAAVTSE